jgi:hypothetical protein
VFSRVGKKTEMFLRFSTVAGERGAADAERDFALKFYTEEGNWDLVGNKRRCSSCAIRTSSPTSSAPRSATRRPTAQPDRAVGFLVAHLLEETLEALLVETLVSPAASTISI